MCDSGSAAKHVAACTKRLPVPRRKSAKNTLESPQKIWGRGAGKHFFYCLRCSRRWSVRAGCCVMIAMLPGTCSTCKRKGQCSIASTLAVRHKRQGGA